MARPSKTAAIDYSATHDLTHGLLERAACPAELPFVLVRDADKRGLRLRVTRAGGKAWQFETRMGGKLFTRALGGWPAVSIDTARQEAHRLRGMTEQGIDPRELERQQEAQKAAADAAATAQAITTGEVWAIYLEARKPHWGERHYRDHLTLSAAGGKPFKRGTGTTQAAPLHSLLALPLRDLTAPVIEGWAETEGMHRPTSARLGWRCLKAFLSWCTEQQEYASLVSGSAAKTRKTREALGKAGVKQDALMREQLPAWFGVVRQLQNPTISAYLQTLLLTGARPGEVITLRWDDLNTQWKGISIRDKVEGTREIPLTPYVSQLLHALPRRNEWIFSSPNSATGYLTEPTYPHTRACKTAGLDGLTLHGLRRSFKSLTEWLEIPAGVVAQLMGHKPSATAEKHYTVRPLDMLRVHHERIEAWILEQGKVPFDAKAEPGKLRVVAGG